MKKLCGRCKSEAAEIEGTDDLYCPNCGANSKAIFFEDERPKTDEREEDE